MQYLRRKVLILYRQELVSLFHLQRKMRGAGIQKVFRVAASMQVIVR